MTVVKEFSWHLFFDAHKRKLFEEQPANIYSLMSVQLKGYKVSSTTIHTHTPTIAIATTITTLCKYRRFYRQSDCERYGMGSKDESCLQRKCIFLWHDRGNVKHLHWNRLGVFVFASDRSNNMNFGGYWMEKSGEGNQSPSNGEIMDE